MSPKSCGIITVLLAMLMESVAQISLKVGAAGGPEIFASPYRQFASRYRWMSSPTTWKALGILFYTIEIALWTFVLHWLDLSIAFPMGSLCFVGVALLSMVFLGEIVDRTRWLGVFCILGGVLLMAL
jgi:multidrug transporter EmrE-like cation transporter